MHLKTGVKTKRFCLMALVLMCILYLLEFKSQAILSELKFSLNNYEEHSCTIFNSIPNIKVNRNIAFTAYSEYYFAEEITESTG